MNMLMPIAQGLSVKHHSATEVEGVIAGFGLIRRTDGRLPEAGRRQRRQNRSKRH